MTESNSTSLIPSNMLEQLKEAADKAADSAKQQDEFASLFKAAEGANSALCSRQTILLKENKTQSDTLKERNQQIAQLEGRIQVHEDREALDQGVIQDLQSVCKKRKAQICDFSSENDSLHEQLRQTELKRLRNEASFAKLMEELTGTVKELPGTVKGFENYGKNADKPTENRMRSVSDASSNPEPFVPFKPIQQAQRIDTDREKKFNLDGRLGELHDQDLIQWDVTKHINEAGEAINQFIKDNGKDEKWLEGDSGYSQVLILVASFWIAFFEIACIHILETDDDLGPQRVELLFEQFVEALIMPYYMGVTDDFIKIRIREYVPGFNSKEREAYVASKKEYLKRFDNDAMHKNAEGFAGKKPVEYDESISW